MIKHSLDGACRRPDESPRIGQRTCLPRRAFLGILPAAFAGWPVFRLPEHQDEGKASTGIEALTTKAAALIKDSGAEDVGVAYHDLVNGDELLIHADATFHAASTMKVPVLMEIFRQAEQKTLSLDDRITVKNEFPSLVDGTPFTLKVEDDSETTLYKRLGERLTIRELSRLMITESSNLATNLLVERVTAARTCELMDRLGAKEVRVLRGVEDGAAYRRGINNTLTARGLMKILSRLAERDVVSKQASEEMLAILRGQKFNEGIPAGLPAGVTVAHKTGSFNGVYHDAAIVEPPRGKPFALVVLTRGIKDERRSHKLVAEIARSIYRHAEAVRAGGGAAPVGNAHPT
jgi:beta-lactamase class A